ncbi:helix-turn-helix domain-containing protein [Bordetella sp. FB-8]|uniref:helix-turn-helix domain-containing protein n=1 Tax=Bordetella sp. FB-8 TaxID=1159870 RepID=UPI0003773E08|nr:XRE family transcriptional regulator [Bordetella sp. FB-8]
MSKSKSQTLDWATLGRRLRTARKQFGWTLTEVAQRSGVSSTTISRAERGQLALGYENFSALARVLGMGMDMAAMFSEDDSQVGQLQGPIVTRKDEGMTYRGLAFSYRFLATQAVGKQMIPTLSTVHARRINGAQDYARHDGEEFVYVINGSIEVYFENGNCLALSAGDSLYFDSRIGHAYVCTSRRLARIVGVCTRESTLMAAARAGAQQSASP